MPCTPLPTPPAPPALPGGITLEPTLPVPDLAAELCCKTFAMPTIPALLPLPPGVFNPALAATITALLDQVLAHVRGRSLPCPKE